MIIYKPAIFYKACFDPEAMLSAIVLAQED